MHLISASDSSFMSAVDSPYAPILGICGPVTLCYQRHSEAQILVVDAQACPAAVVMPFRIDGPRWAPLVSKFGVLLESNRDK